MKQPAPGPAHVGEMRERTIRATSAATGYPCTLCCVRPDVACRHRPADPHWKPAHDAVDLPDVRLGPKPGMTTALAKHRERIRAARRN